MIALLFATALWAAPAITPAVAQPPSIEWAMADELQALVASCPAAQISPGRRRMERAMHVPRPDNVVLPQLRLMLRADPRECPGIAAIAARRMRDLVGVPERPDVHTGVLALAREMAEEGLGMARDPELADRYGRVLWLFENEAPELPRWTAAQQQAWLERPETIVLLDAHLTHHRYAAFRQARMLAALRLRRDLPGYDPEAALALYQRAIERERYAEILTDGVHMPVDYRRATGAFLRTPMFGLDAEQQRALLRMGRQAVAAARTREEEAQALRILFAASVESVDNSCQTLAAQRRQFDRAPEVPLADGEARRIEDELTDDFRGFMIDDDVPNPRPIVLRGLIDPDGRLIYAEVRQSSGSRDRDRFAILAWAEYAEEVDLSATSRGRFVWTLLSPIPQQPTTAGVPGGRASRSCA